MPRFLLLSLAVSAISCSTAPVGFGGLKVVVTPAPGLSSRCARVVARGSRDRQSNAVVLADRASFIVGISQDGEPVEVEVQALGYSDEACTVLTTPAERSESRASRFGSPPVEVALTLRLDPVDLDGDGFTSDDCDEGNAAINPGATESCTNGVDDDCDLSLDCADSSCESQVCRVGGGSACVNQGCTETLCGDSLDNDGDSSLDCADTDCVGQPCGTGGTCNAGGCVAPMETGLCSDGIDNDSDGATDCADSECPQGSMCSDANACTLADTCGAPGVGCVRGSDVTCTMPPAGCFATAGRCVPDAGCTYALMTGSCQSNLFCTQNSTCLTDGGCVGTPRVCNTPPNTCHAATGACLESARACAYAPLPSGGCNDSNNCTVSDSCDGDGGCAGITVTCTPPGECFTTATTCQADGGCIFNVRMGACSVGTCNGVGACVGPPVFSYTPSNFTEAQLPSAPTGPVLVNCNVDIDTRTADGGVSWTTCGSGPAAPPHKVIAVGSNTAVLFYMDSLTLNGSAQLKATGSRPVIFAVKNTVLINGRLDVDSAGSRGAGSDIDCAVGAGTNGTASGAPQTAGGGGGGGFLTDGTTGSAGANGGPAGARGGVNGTEPVVPLRGGCRGGNGGRATNATSASGVGGRGGGAVQVSAGGSITINTSGTIAASGEGGQGGLVDQRIGGGGGGTGGAIVLEGTTITVNSMGALVANGGAGGEGSGFGDPMYSGVDGQNGRRSELRAVCPFIGACGGNGGGGGARAGDPTDPSSPGCGTNMPGGGGGGSAGRIRLNAVNGCTLNGSAIISPAPTGTGANCP